MIKVVDIVLLLSLSVRALVADSRNASTKATVVVAYLTRRYKTHLHQHNTTTIVALSEFKMSISILYG